MTTVHNDAPAGAMQILKHYLDNPRATDSVEGVATWRLLEEIVLRRLGETEEALQWLVAHGYLEERVAGAAPPLYRLNLQRRRDAERLVLGGKPDPTTKM
jgi:hypothetical protein